MTHLVDQASQPMGYNTHPDTHCCTLAILGNRCRDHFAGALLDQVLHCLVNTPQHLQALGASRGRLAQRGSIAPFLEHGLELSGRRAERTFGPMHLGSLMLDQLPPLPGLTTPANAGSAFGLGKLPPKPRKLTFPLLPSLLLWRNHWKVKSRSECQSIKSDSVSYSSSPFLLTNGI